MPVLDEFKTRLGSVASLMDQTQAKAAQFAADLSAARDQLKTMALNLEDWIMLNAPQLVAEAVAKLQADQDNAAALQKQIDADKVAAAGLQAKLDAATAQVADLQSQVVPPETLAALDAKLHPPVDVPVAPVVPA